MKVTMYHPSMHLDATQLIAAEKLCPVCGSESPRSRIGLIQHDPAIYLLCCSTCCGCSASQMPRPHVLDEYYSRYFASAGPKITLSQVSSFVGRLLRVMRFNTLPRHVRILDFGGGDGTLGLAITGRLLREQSDRRVAFTLVDYQSPGAFEANERLTVTHRRKLEQVEGPFDLVLASAILEHIPDLRPVIEHLFRMLAPRGWFYARTPYAVPLKRLLPKLDITYPGHVHDLGAPFWNRVPATYRQPLRIVVSQPSLIETNLLRQPGRTIAAWLMKLPARIELSLFPSPRTPLWRLVGGWEVILQRASGAM
jgi:SAM-dependent methyltransferase